MDSYDLIIIGGGAAAFAAAMKADELGANTLMVEKGTIGGTCVNVGCLPTKHLLRVGEVFETMNNSPFKGVKGKAELDFSTAMAEKDELVAGIRKKKYKDVLDSLSGTTFIEGKAEFISDHEVTVKGKIYKGQSFIIATGSSTFIPPVEGIGKVNYLTNIEALSLSRRPDSMVILGGGALGLEFAQMYSRFGTKVCLLQKAERLVPREEPELAGLLMKYLQEEGIEICTGAEIKQASAEGRIKCIRAIVGGRMQNFGAEKLLLATGRRPNTYGWGLEHSGIRLDDKGAILVDDEMRTHVEHIWAAGDVTGEPMLETVAAKEGAIAAHNALSAEKKKMDYTVVPHAVFTNPQLAGVGLSDEEAIRRGIRCRCSTVSLDIVPKAAATNDTKGAIKMVIDDGSEKILGVHALSSMAADIVHEAAMIIRNRMTVEDVIDTLHVFPTMTEAVKIVAQSFKKDVRKMACCVE